MVHYGFYKDQYLGSVIPENEFPQAAQRAMDALERFKGIYRVTSAGEVSENMALCAMAEAVYAAFRRTPAVSAATIGKVSVQYGKTESLDRQLLRKAAIYLDVKRGVG